MIVAGAFDPNGGADLPSTNVWLNQPNLYTDLNSPVASGTTTTGSTAYIFPIIDNTSRAIIDQQQFVADLFHRRTSADHRGICDRFPQRWEST